MQTHEVDIFGKKCVVTTNCKKSAKAIVPGEKTPGRTEQSIVLSTEAEGGQHGESRILPGGRLPAKGSCGTRKACGSLGVLRYQAHKWGYIKADWNVAGSPVLTCSITNERLAQAGYYSILSRYESVHGCD